MAIQDAIAARTAKQAKYDKANTQGLYLKLNYNTDKDILEWFSHQQSKQGAIKQLIREAIAKEPERPQRITKPLDDEGI